MKFKLGDRVHYIDDTKDTGVVTAVDEECKTYLVDWHGIKDPPDTPFSDSVLFAAVNATLDNA